MRKALLLTLLGGVLAFGCASPEPRPAGDYVLIQNGTLIDGTGASPQAGTDLVIRNDGSRGSDKTWKLLPVRP